MIIQEILHELNSFADSSAKRMYLEEHINDIMDGIFVLSDTDKPFYIEKLCNAFDGTGSKAAIKKYIDAALEHREKQEAKNRIADFSSVDYDILDMSPSGMLFPTQDNFYNILLAANRVKMIWEDMSANIYYTNIDWDTPWPTFKIPGVPGEYHRNSEYHTTELKRKLNKNGFPSESRWFSLKEAHQNVAQKNRVDFYQLYMRNIEEENPDDGIDRFTIDNCFAVKYLGAPKEQWSAIWSRVLMMSLVWRCFSPGCPQRYYFTIEGEQNIGKTQFCRALVPNFWYTSAALSARDDIIEFYRGTYDKAVIEFAELGGTDRASKNLFKRVVTETHSTFRRMRADDVVDYPKRNIIILTTNETEFLGRDESGDTRAVTLRSDLRQNEFMLLAEFAKEYPKILAQAIRMYDAGISCYLNLEEFDLQKAQIEKRDVVFTSEEYDIICGYFLDNNVLDIAKQQGAYLDPIYDYAMGEWSMTKPEIMKRARAFSAALKKYGFSKHDNKAVQIDGKPRKVWYWRD